MRASVAALVVMALAEAGGAVATSSCAVQPYVGHARDECSLMWLTGVAAQENIIRKNASQCCPNLSGFVSPVEGRVLFVHVGKTGGSSVESWLNQMHGRGVTFLQVHVHAVLPATVMQHDRIIVSVRDPIERIFSAFNYETNRNKRFFRTIINCFGSLEELTQTALLRNTSTPSCIKAAMAAIRYMAPTLEAIGGHMPLGLCYYLGGLLPALETREVWLVRQETLATDLHNLANAWLQRAAATADLLPPVPRLNLTPRRGNMLSNSSRDELCKVLAGEYALLQKLEQIAVNSK